MGRHDDEAVWNFMAGLFGVVFTLTVSSIFRGYVLSKMWLWFIVPFGVGELSVVHAIGLSMTVAFLTYQYDAAKDKERQEGSFGEKLVMAFIAGNLMTAMMWGMGAIVHAFM